MGDRRPGEVTWLWLDNMGFGPGEREVGTRAVLLLLRKELRYYLFRLYLKRKVLEK